jgi:hypothetical protein
VSEKTPAPESAEPVEADATPVAAESTDPAQPVVASDAEPAVEASDPAAVDANSAAPASQHVVYVEAPQPPAKKGNRAVGVLIAILSAVIFAVLYAVITVIVELVENSPVDFGFVGMPDFWAPVLTFLVGFILLVLIVNRAGWAAHVIGSIFVGLVVFFGGTGIILLLHINQIPSNQIGQAFSQVLFDSGSIVAALLAREVSLWMGFAVAARGRKVRARNADARVLYDQEIAAKRAEYEQANARNATGQVEPVVAEPVGIEPVVAEPVVGETVVADTTAP